MLPFYIDVRGITYMITSVKLFALAHPITLGFRAQRKIASKVRKGSLPQSNFMGTHTQKVYKRLCQNEYKHEQICCAHWLEEVPERGSAFWVCQ